MSSGHHWPTPPCLCSLLHPPTKMGTSPAGCALETCSEHIQSITFGTTAPHAHDCLLRNNLRPGGGGRGTFQPIACPMCMCNVGLRNTDSVRHSQTRGVLGKSKLICPQSIVLRVRGSLVFSMAERSIKARLSRLENGLIEFANRATQRM